MKSLYNLSIRKKFALVIVPLIVIILCFDYLQIKHKYFDYKDASRLNKAIVVGIEINHVVHELQKERSISVGFLANGGADFLRDLAAQRRKTDSTIHQFEREIEDPKLSDLIQLHGEDLAHLRNYFAKIKQLRNQVDELDVNTEEAIDYFSDINNIALNTVNELINETRDKSVAQQVHAIIYFLKSKEYSSIERAIGTQAFATSHLDYETYREFTTVVAKQNAFMEAFRTISNEESKEYYNRIVTGPDVEQVERLRALLFENGEFEEDPQYWYDISTNRINGLKRVEDFMSDKIQQYTESIASGANQSFWGFVALDLAIGIIAFFLMTTIVSNLLENVKRLEEYTRKVSSGELESKVQIQTRDELGKYAQTFNIMVDEIKKSQAALKKERDHANYLYENIYKQSEVVFENVQQGIFLLDDQFRISKLYSKAMEGIFDRKKIGGESFTSFMRPLILPRELEALEMFMRHLFNPEMDEAVVNQLNPIEQVKIFTEKNGTVSNKYIKVSFTRIFGKAGIQNIMVTVSDETKSVLLQKHLEEAETKKKQETEQVLSILKIDPSVMRGFLFNSKKTLTQISEKYESNDGEDYSELLDYTFETIHNLKGNASVIGLELMSAKFHEIEEGITQLKGRDIKGKDFLSVLYEIDQADKMLNEMNVMLRKVANIYRTIPSEGQVVSNIMVINTLQKGVETLSEETGKSVNFNINNEDNVVIPEQYINPFRDSMIQLIRNSLAHGIEPASERMAQGKSSKGNIIVDISTTQDDELLVSYKDDGAGLDIDKIKEQAVTRNIISEFEAEKMADDEVPALIFHAGFSTTEKADNVSGRGQGMNLVKSLIEEHNGEFEINFDKGRFFEMVIKLPGVHQSEDEETEEIEES